MWLLWCSLKSGFFFQYIRGAEICREMRKTVLILSTDESQSRPVYGMLANVGFRPEVKSDCSLLAEKLNGNSVAAIILDLDGACPDNKMIRRFKQKNPSIALFGMSANTFHPALKESLEKHIFACMLKPVDPDELLFLLKCGCEGRDSIYNGIP